MANPFPVLVCDDSLIARKQVVRYFKQHDVFSVTQASNGQEALSLLEQHKFGLLCLDLTMPVLDGLGVLAALKNKQIHIHTIIISADVQPEMRQRVADYGVLGFVEKPFKGEEFSSILHKFGIR